MVRFLMGFLFAFVLSSYATYCRAADDPANGLTLIIIRHGEKPDMGSNLTCRGLNRALALPGVIQKKFGVPDFIYVPSLKMAEKTSHARMFETAVPLAAKYNLNINSKYDEKDITGLAAGLKAQHGVVLVVWEHSMIGAMIRALGVADTAEWEHDDYDSIWIVAFADGKAKLSKDKEGLNPSDDCP